MSESEIVIATLMRHSGGSGLQSHVRTFDEHLRDVSRRVSIVSPFTARSPFVLPMFAARIGIRPLSRPAAVWWHQYWHAHYLKAALTRQLAHRPDAVIYAQCPISAGVALQVRTTQPVVMVAHFNISQADEWADEGEIPRGGRLFRSIRSFEDRVLRGLDGIVYVSEFTKAGLEDRLPVLRDLPSAVVPNAVSRSSATPGRSVPRADLITVGRLDSRKNHRYLLEILAAAAARGHRYTLSVVGDGADRQALEARTAELGLADQVTFLGYQPDPRGLMREHRIYCHTSTTETFGIVLVEAMSEGLPVIAAPVGGVPEVVRAGTDGLFWPLDDASAAADVLIGLMGDPAAQSALAAAAQSRARAEFSAEVAGERLLTFLEHTGIRPEQSLV
ncbi:glycosyltransferase family 4 protein [Kribbella sp. NPDC026611]|uniref:glycosyltransferase family 4 protein n=1 Tax=Kribbella sp. NPDC026611 TaxID=3154911 RepID=UPI00340466C8